MNIIEFPFFDYDIYNKWFMVVIQNIRVSCVFQETELNFS